MFWRTGVPGAPVLFIGLSLLSAQSARNKKPPAMRVRVECYTKKSPFRYNVGVQATLQRKER